MNIETIREAHRKAGAELVTELGYDPNDVSEDLAIVGQTAKIKVVLRDAEGKVMANGDEVATRLDYKRITTEQRDRYRQTVRRESEGA
jgi:hypothetical protein